jgi:hypothetical protein
MRMRGGGRWGCTSKTTIGEIEQIAILSDFTVKEAGGLVKLSPIDKG